MISESLLYEKQFETVHGKRIAYLKAGSSVPIVLLHGNPTSSFLWRNVIPELESSGWVIVPDLIGQGDSENLSAGDDLERSWLKTLD
jgi:haloalkane dehalogenase